MTRSIISEEQVNRTVLMGKPIRESGRVLGVNPFTLYDALERADKIPLWLEKRKKIEESKKSEQKEKEEAHQKLVDTLAHYTLSVASKSGFASQKALEYFFRNNYVRKNWFSREKFEKMVRLFKAYDEARSKGERLSIYQLAEISGLFFVRAGEILRKVGLKSMYHPYIPKKKKNVRNILGEERRESIKRAFYTDMTIKDLSYFLGLPFWTIKYHFQLLGKRGDKTIWIFQAGFACSSEDRLDYRRASKIYEAIYAGFSSEEICEYAEVSDRARQYAIENRKGIEEKIVMTLREIFKDESIDKPYLD